MMEYVLLFNGRRRVYIVNKIKEYLKSLDLNIGIYLTDTDNLDPVGYYADKFSVLPPIEDENFVDTFIKFVKKENIKYIFLWNNKDFYIFHKMRKKLKDLNIKILLPNKEQIDACFNKVKTNEFCKTYNIPTPKTYYNLKDFYNSDCGYPVIVKPYNGAGNLNIFKADNKEELEIFYKKVPNAIIQEFIEGEQYTIDAFFDEITRVVVPRKRVKVRDAEVVEASICLDKKLIEIGEKVADSLKVLGPINIQVILKNNIPYVIDMHCRFGGGTDLSIEAGVPIDKWIVNLLIGKKNDYKYKINDKLFMTRYLKSDFIEV
ncbi:MAG: ATP-grasp domain-containing protein [Bacilli bacterium]|nr:ATP-grasp domain-containing protein [Bacilli bacterium]